jgi:5-methylcytosine-specific restriction endonuclease McrA
MRGYIARLGNAQAWCCFHCGHFMLKTSAVKLPSGSHDMGWTREHVVPKKLGGFNRGNLVLAHHHCNTARGHQAPGPGMMQRAKAIWIAARDEKRRSPSTRSAKT